MRKIVLMLILSQISIINYGQIIADHTVIDDFDKIPAYYISEVKKMLLVTPGESHSEGYRAGLTLVEGIDASYDVNISNQPEAPTTSYLRTTHVMWGDYSHESGWIGDYGEEDWWTNATAISRTKGTLAYYNSTLNNPITAIGFGWCWDMIFGAASSGSDPITGNHWYGWSEGSSSGNLAWGIDDTDNSITGNVVNINDYLSATQEYIDYCETNNIPTKVIFTTGPVDNCTDYISDEAMYQGYLKHEAIRNYVKSDVSRILFDYADILCYDDNGSQTTKTWNGHAFPFITPTNLGDGNYAHIGQAGELKLGKALWWMLARIAGWDGGIATIPVTDITVSGAAGANTIITDNGTLQLNTTITPADATNKTVTWSNQNGTGQASISASGLVTAITNGTVTARATANDGSGVFGTLTITISNQVIPVTGISVTGAGGSSIITSNDGTLQLNAAITPDNATDKTVTWSVQNGTGQASISTSGLVTAITPGTVVARATANDGSGVFGMLTITISNQAILVTGITISGSGGATTITTDNGSLQLNTTITPADATNKTVTWSIQNGTGQASISTSGMVTALANGTVTARATANDGSAVYGTLTITISSQTIPVTGITVTGAGGASTISTDNGTFQLSATIAPADASNKNVTWSLQNGTGQASISTSGLVTAIANGTVTARATANDGSAVYGTLAITISNQTIPVTGITVTGAGGATTIFTNNGTLQLSATITPADATNKTVTWSVQNGTGQASISTSGLVTAIANGTITARATANDGSAVYGTLTITISSQTIPVTGITVTGAVGATTISADNGTLQLSATITPVNATNKTVTWSIHNGTGQATISASGIVTAITNGAVTARATANDGSGIYGELTITINNQVIPVTAITITGEGGLTSIITDDGTLQLNAVVKPENATNKTVTWSLQNGDGVIATINSSGLLTAITNGLVTAQATAQDGSGISGVLNVTIENQNPPTGTNDPDAKPFDITISYSRIVIHMHDDQKFHHIFLYNMQGSLISGKKITGNDHYFDLANLIPGAYIILLSGAETNESVKFSVPFK